MTFGKWALRVVLFAGGVVLSLVLLTFLAVQTQQRILRWRAERLLADMHQIRLYQSTWAEAQRLMHRWGAWGHYDGSCTAASCKYEIEMVCIPCYNPRVPRHAWLDWLMMHDRFNLFEWFGGRGSGFYAAFTVHNGTIWRKGVELGLDVPTKKTRIENQFEQTLILSVESRQQLHRSPGEYGVFMGSDNQLSQHPYYKVGGPSGCKPDCQIRTVYFPTHTPYEEVTRLTSFDFSCFTRFKACTDFEQFYPLAKEWHDHKDLGDSCRAPIWALARDADYVLVIRGLGSKEKKEKGWSEELVKVKVIDLLKKSSAAASSPWTPGAIVGLQAWAALPALVPEKQYIVFPDDDEWGNRAPPKNVPIQFLQCGIEEDTPETRRELEKGFEQNDTLRP
jgi:hypothetical protein